MTSLPIASVVEENFWAENEIPYGSYGNVVKDSTAFLYGLTDTGVSIAKEPADSIENKTTY